MAISIGGTVVIDDSRNIVNVNDIRVGVVTITGSTGNIETPGTITGAGFSIVGAGITISPGAGTTDVNAQTTGSIILSFPTSVTRGTGTVSLRTVSAGGTTFRSYDAATSPEITVLNNTWAVSVATTFFAGSPVLPFGQTVFLVIPSTAIGGFAGLNTTGADSYSFATQAGALGQGLEGGFLICKSGGTQWIVSTYEAEVSRTWYLRNDANTRAQQVSGCTGWFVPTVSQLQNPGYCCRTFWGPSPCFSSRFYWSSTEINATFACPVYFVNGNAGYRNKTISYCVRSFRCVTY